MHETVQKQCVVRIWYLIVNQCHDGFYGYGACKAMVESVEWDGSNYEAARGGCGSMRLV
jgi:hypothetical protein